MPERSRAIESSHDITNPFPDDTHAGTPFARAARVALLGLEGRGVAAHEQGSNYALNAAKMKNKNKNHKDSKHKRPTIGTTSAERDPFTLTV